MGVVFDLLHTGRTRSSAFDHVKSPLASFVYRFYILFQIGLCLHSLPYWTLFVYLSPSCTLFTQCTVGALKSPTGSLPCRKPRIFSKEPSHRLNTFKIPTNLFAILCCTPSLRYSMLLMNSVLLRGTLSSFPLFFFFWYSLFAVEKTTVLPHLKWS